MNFKQIAEQIVKDLQLSFTQKDLVATGKTRDSIRYELTSNGFQILGASYIENVELGRPPRVSTNSSDFLERLEEWRKARNVSIPARTLQYLINKFGTKQYQSGQSNNVVSDVINLDLVEEIRKQIVAFYSLKVATNLRKVFVLD